MVRFMPGPIGDGSTDDTAAIQLGLDAGGEFRLGPGTYLITDTLVIPDDGALIGAGANATIIKGANMHKALIAGQFTLPGFVLQNKRGKLIGLQITNQSKSNAGGIGFDARQWANMVCEDVTIAECERGIALEGACYFNDFRNVRVSDCATGFTVKNGAKSNVWVGGKIAACTTGIDIAGGTLDGINHLTMVGTSINSNTKGVSLDGTVSNVQAINLISPRLEGNTTNISLDGDVEYIRVLSPHIAPGAKTHADRLLGADPGAQSEREEFHLSSGHCESI